MSQNSGLGIIFIIVAGAFGGLVAYDIKINNRLEKWSAGDNWQWSDKWTDSSANPIQNPPTSPVMPPVAPVTPTEPTVQIIASSYQDALKKSEELSKPILIIFGGEWCTWCKKLEKEVLPSPEVKNLMKNYIFVKIDVDVSRDVVRKFGVSTVPAYAITNHQEVNLKFGAGFKDATEFAAWLNNPDLLKVPPKDLPKRGPDKKDPDSPKIRPDRRQPDRTRPELFPNRKQRSEPSEG